MTASVAIPEEDEEEEDVARGVATSVPVLNDDAARGVATSVPETDGVSNGAAWDGRHALLAVSAGLATNQMLPTPCPNTSPGLVSF